MAQEIVNARELGPRGLEKGSKTDGIRKPSVHGYLDIDGVQIYA